MPTLVNPRDEAATDPRPPAPRRDPLAGKSVALFDISKPGGKVFEPHVGIGAVPGIGEIDTSDVHLWKMRRPLDANEFKRQWSSKFEKQ